MPTPARRLLTLSMSALLSSSCIFAQDFADQRPEVSLEDQIRNDLLDGELITDTPFGLRGGDQGYPLRYAYRMRFEQDGSFEMDSTRDPGEPPLRGSWELVTLNDPPQSELDFELRFTPSEGPAELTNTFLPPDEEQSLYPKYDVGYSGYVLDYRFERSVQPTIEGQFTPQKPAEGVDLSLYVGDWGPSGGMGGPLGFDGYRIGEDSAGELRIERGRFSRSRDWTSSHAGSLTSYTTYDGRPFYLADMVGDDRSHLMLSGLLEQLEDPPRRVFYGLAGDLGPLVTLHNIFVCFRNCAP